jgi:hypothetical protein
LQKSTFVNVLHGKESAFRSVIEGAKFANAHNLISVGLVTD